MPKPPRNPRYRQGFTEVFEYFERLPGSRKVRQGKDWDAKIGSPRYNTLKAYQLGRLPTNKEADAAQSKPVLQLVDILVERKLLASEVAPQFARDLSDGLSILRYLPPSDEISAPQPAILLKDRAHLSQLQRHLTEHFVGYEEQQALIWQYLKAGRRVILHGQPGAGKTSLAARIVEAYLNDQQDSGTRQRVVWIETGYGGIKQVQALILLALQEGSDRDIALRAANVGLMVLDNVWNEELTEWINSLSRSIGVLITSREPLRTERRELVPLDGLQTGEALDLLGTYAGTLYTPGGDAEKLCGNLGFLPLALKIAGSLIAETRQSPRMVARNLLQITHDRVDSNMTYASLIEQNFRSRSIEPSRIDDVRASFRAFGALFNRQIPRLLLDTYQEVALGKDRTELARAMESYLNRQNITQTDGDYYYVNDVIFALSREQCSDAERQYGVEACERYVRQHVERGSRAGFQAIWLGRENLLGALHYAWSTPAQPPDNHWFEDMVWLLASNGYFDAKGYTREWLQYLERAVQLAQERHDLNRAHYLWAKIGNGYTLFQGRFEGENRLPDALKAYVRALEFAPGVTDENAIVRESISLSLIGVTYARLGNAEQAEQYFRRALQKGVGYPAVLSQIYEHMGRYAAELKEDLDEARAYFLDSLKQSERIEGDVEKWHQRCFYAHVNLGEVEMRAENYERALEHVGAAWSFADKSNNDDLRARAASEMGEKLLAFGQPEEAFQWLERALEFYQRVDDEENNEYVRALMQQAVSAEQSAKG